MKQTRLIMGMPITLEVVDAHASQKDLDDIFEYFIYVDKTFSTYKKNSEISLFNAKKLQKKDLSADVKTIFQLAQDTKKETNGFFDINKNGYIDPSGIVKGWAIYNGAQKLLKKGFKNFYVEAGGDIQVSGKNSKGEKWTVGIRNPFNAAQVVKVLKIDGGIATSGTYIRGQHIYNPFNKKQKIIDIVSFTVIGPNVYDADRFATAAFAMGKEGIHFIEKLDGFEGYMIDKNGIATMTSGFDRYL